MATDRPRRRTALALAALAALTVTAGACSAPSTSDRALSAPSAVTAGEGDATMAPALGAIRHRGGWDGNSNEPLLADDFA